MYIDALLKPHFSQITEFVNSVGNDGIIFEQRWLIEPSTEYKIGRKSPEGEAARI